MNTSFRCWILTAAVLLPSPDEGWAQSDALFQELAVTGVVAISPHPEFPSPWGLGAYAAWDIWGHWRLKLSYLRLWDESEKPGLVCKVYAPNIDCQPSQTFNEVTLSGFRGGLLRTFILRNWLRVGLGAGLSFNEVNASSRGENGEEADLLAPNAGHIGYLAMGSAEWIPFATVPLRINTSVSHHWVDFNSCSGWVPPQYDPYCEVGRFLEMEVGAAVVF